MREEATTTEAHNTRQPFIVALRDERGSYNRALVMAQSIRIVALRDERGSYNTINSFSCVISIVALRDERGSYNQSDDEKAMLWNCSTTR